MRRRPAKRREAEMPVVPQRLPQGGGRGEAGEPGAGVPSYAHAGLLWARLLVYFIMVYKLLYGVRLCRVIDVGKKMDEKSGVDMDNYSWGPSIVIKHNSVLCRNRSPVWWYLCMYLGLGAREVLPRTIIILRISVELHYYIKPMYCSKTRCELSSYSIGTYTEPK